MNVRKFFAKTSREALNMVKKELGDSAIILSNRAVEGGNEIIASAEDDMDKLINAASSPASEVTFSSVMLRSNRRQSQQPNQQQAHEPERHDSFVSRIRQQEAEVAPVNTPARVELTTIPVASNHDIRAEMADIINEIRGMRDVLQSQIAEISWANAQQREPFKVSLLNRMLAAGFSPSLSRQITEKLPKFNTLDEAVRWANAVLCKNMRTIDSDENMLDHGGVYAIIGPTGVGKTTTTAKLAARFVMKHGANKLGLITTDSYRIGGHEQLRIYGKILGVMVHAVNDPADLEIALNELRHKHTILIDTVGVSQRDRMVTEQMALLNSNSFHIKKLLCLNATNTNETLIDVISAYRGRGVDGCILTKLDEAVTIGSAMDVIIREKLKLHYVTNGQRVPEDLHLPNKQLLMHRTFKQGASNTQAFQHRPEDLAVMMANSLSAEASHKTKMSANPKSQAKVSGMEFNHV